MGIVLAAGKPAITTGNTWMTDEAKRLGGAVCGIERHDAESLLEAVERMLQNLQELQAEAKRAAPVWRAEHNEEKLLECLLTGAGLATRSR